MLEKILILDFGSQFTQLIARRIRELNVYAEIIPYHKKFSLDESTKAVVLSGSPFSVRDENAPTVDFDSFVNKVPVLGICYGAQLLAQHYGGEVSASSKREYGKSIIEKTKSVNSLWRGIKNNKQVWMSHADTVTKLPPHTTLLAQTTNGAIASFKFEDKNKKAPVYCVQFHPEVTHTEIGKALLHNFIINIAGCTPSWTSEKFVQSSVADLQARLGNDEVILGLSGGVDSSVAALLLHKAVGKNLKCIFIDNGLLRKNEFEEVLEDYKILGLNVIGVDAKTEFYAALAGISDPEKKRKAIGGAFIDVFDREAKKFNNAKWLAQGTIYPDVIESISVHGPSVTIKSHHNVGGLPEKMNLKIVEPLRMLFKDEVRRVGAELNLPENILMRHPFPGPGLAIRIIGDITPEKVELLQKADAIFIANLKKWNLYTQVWQAGVILLPVQSVGVMGDERTYERVVVLRSVNSSDGMTAEWSRFPHDFLAAVSTEIINSVKGINRVVYDISTKPPATIEWE